MYLFHNLKSRSGLLVFGCLAVLYFASLRWCFKARERETEEVYKPVFIHLGQFFDRNSNYEQISPLNNDDLQISVLDSLINGPRLDEEAIKSRQNEDILFFNRVPKTGSEMMVLLLQWLQGQNGFRHHRLRNPLRRYFTLEEQLEMAAEIGEIINNSQERLISFDRHIHFTNFSQIGLKMPILINILRDPVEKITSRFYYARVTPRSGGFTPPNYIPKTDRPQYLSLEECVLAKSTECTFLDGHEYDLSIPYFCGHKNYCRELNNVAALLTAKRNAEQWYTVIGVLEDLNTTLAVFESKLPKFFKGVTRLYFEELHAMHLNKNWQKPSDIPPKWILDQIRKNLTMEYDFYHFIRQKLHQDFLQITAETF